jgi:hypothetical protein
MNRKLSNEQKALLLQAVVGKIKKPQAAERVYGVLDDDSRIKTIGSKSILYSKSSGVTSAIATTVPLLLLSDSTPKLG